VSVNVCEAAEVPKAGWKVNGIHEFPGQGTQESYFSAFQAPPIFVLARIWRVGLNAGPVRGSRFMAKTL